MTVANSPPIAKCLTYIPMKIVNYRINQFLNYFEITARARVFSEKSIDVIINFTIGNTISQGRRYLYLRSNVFHGKTRAKIVFFFFFLPGHPFCSCKCPIGAARYKVNRSVRLHANTISYPIATHGGNVIIQYNVVEFDSSVCLKKLRTASKYNKVTNLIRSALRSI